jgi:hypothetical protein
MREHPLHRIERLRPVRRVRDADVGLGSVFEAAARAHARAAKKTGAASEAWEAVCPAPLLERTAVRGIARGTLVIAVADAATRYALDVALRSGLQRELVKRCPTTVRSVKLELAPADPGEDVRGEPDNAQPNGRDPD